MHVNELIDNFPIIFHMAEAGSWENIQQHGLLSTTALLNLYQVKGEERVKLESQHRPECVTINHKGLTPAVVRDQKPMSDKGLEKALLDGITPKEWYETLNSKTFFWATEKRLHTLLNAKAYKNREQDVLTVDTKKLVDTYENAIVLSPYNSGSTKPNPFARGRDTFLPISDYPYDMWVNKRGSKKLALAEICVEGGVPDMNGLVIEVRRMQANDIRRILYSRD